MKISMKVAVACYALGSVIGLLMTVRYWSASEFMPYHAVVSGNTWESLSPGLQRIVLALLKAAGAGFLATSVVTAALIVPVVRGNAWARWTSLGASFALLLPLVYLSVSLWVDTGAPAPVVQSIGALVLSAVAFVAAGIGRHD